MLTKDLIEKFYKDVESLGLKQPVKAITEATGFNKGTVSIYLNRKDEPSENFLKAFYNKFGDSLKNGSVKPQEAQQAPDYRDDIISLLKEKLNLSERKALLYLQTNNALLKTILQTVGKIQAKVDKRKLEEILVELNNITESHLRDEKIGGN